MMPYDLGPRRPRPEDPLEREERLRKLRVALIALLIALFAVASLFSLACVALLPSGLWKIALSVFFSVFMVSFFYELVKTIFRSKRGRP